MPARKSTKTTAKAAAEKVEAQAEEAAEPTPDAKSDQAVAVTGRPNDNPINEPTRHFANTTFAERVKARGRNKRVADADSK